MEGANTAKILHFRRVRGTGPHAKIHERMDQNPGFVRGLIAACAKMLVSLTVIGEDVMHGGPQPRRAAPPCVSRMSPNNVMPEPIRQ